MDPASVRARLGRAAPRAKTHQPSVLRWSAVAERHEKRQLLIPTFEDHLYRPSSGNHFKMVSLLVVLCDLAFFSLIVSPGFENSLRASKRKKITPQSTFPTTTTRLVTMPLRFEKIYMYVCVRVLMDFSSGPLRCSGDSGR